MSIAALEETYLEAAAELRSKEADLQDFSTELHRFVQVRDQLQAHPDFSGSLPQTYYSGGHLDPTGIEPCVA